MSSINCQTSTCDNDENKISTPSLPSETITTQTTLCNNIDDATTQLKNSEILKQQKLKALSVARDIQLNQERYDALTPIQKKIENAHKDLNMASRYEKEALAGLKTLPDDEDDMTPQQRRKYNYYSRLLENADLCREEAYYYLHNRRD
jgi:hypothetical protein